MGGVTDSRTDRTAPQSTDRTRDRHAESTAGSPWTPLANPARTRRS